MHGSGRVKIGRKHDPGAGARTRNSKRKRSPDFSRWGEHTTWAAPQPARRPDLQSNPHQTRHRYTGCGAAPYEAWRQRTLTRHPTDLNPHGMFRSTLCGRTLRTFKQRTFSWSFSRLSTDSGAAPYGRFLLLMVQSGMGGACSQTVPGSDQ